MVLPTLCQSPAPLQKKRMLVQKKSAYSTLLKVFGILKKNNSTVCFYLIWDLEPGAEPIPALTDVKQFPSDLDSMQVYAKITNPWDLRKLHPSELDSKTGQLKKQKALYLVFLVGMKYTLDS